MEQQPILEVQLLGRFCLKIKHREIRQGITSRLEALLAYLLLHRDAPIPRQRLAFLFWPDTGEKQAHTNLRNLLYKLRSVLPEADSYLYIDQVSMHWRPSLPFTLDIDRFSSLADNSSSIVDLQQAVHLYGGDLLPDCYDEWIHGHREGLHQTYLMTLERLLLLLAEKQRPRDALQFAHLLLRQEPTREETYQHLMRLHMQCGDRASVARVYKTCVKVLDKELGVEPGPTTWEVYQQCITQEIKWTLSSGSTDILSQGKIPNNLPAPLNRLIGREREMVQVKELLSRNRLVTLTGPGGIGKTRLSLATARELLADFRDGVYLIDLAPVSDPKTVTLTVADALQTGDQVRAAGLEGLTDYLSDQKLLLLLDNCEHLGDEVATICQALLPACPQLTILTTSRVAMKIYGEVLYQVPALPTPVQLEKSDPGYGPVQAGVIRNNESAELFMERAISALPTFQTDQEVLFAIGEICRRLEGMPLAIEMVAARITTLSVQQILQRLERTTELLHHPSPGNHPRHRTMEAVTDWSHSLLTPAERNLFARLAVFSGTFSLQAAEEICHGQGIQKDEILSLLASLVDQSLVGTQPMFPEARFRMHEVVRQYSHQKLTGSDRLDHWKDRHLEYFVGLAETAEPKIRGSQQLEWLNQLDLELENLRSAFLYALNRSVASEGKDYYIESLARLAGSLWMFWFIRGRFSEGRRWAEKALQFLRGKVGNSPSLGKVLYTAGAFCYFQGDFTQAEELSLEGIRVCKSCNDLFGEAVSRHHLGDALGAQGDLSHAHEQLHKGLELAISLDDPWLISVLSTDLAILAKQEGNQQSSLEWEKKSLEIARKSGDKFGIMYSLLNLADTADENGDTRQAALLAEDALSLSRELGEKRGIAFALNLLGRVAMQQGAQQRTRELLQQSLRIIWDTRDRDSILGILIDLVDCFGREGKYEIAARLLAAWESARSGFPAGYRSANQSTYDRLVATLPNYLDEGTFTASWTLGRLMSLDQAVRYALSDHSQEPPKSNLRR